MRKKAPAKPTPATPPRTPPSTPPSLPTPSPPRTPLSPPRPSRNRRAPPPPPYLPNPDYYLLVLQWPSSFCKNKEGKGSCKNREKKRTKVFDIPLHFTVHGFWPKMLGGEDPTLPSGVDPRKFEMSQIPPKDFITLKENWIDLTSTDIDPYVFWHYQWDKHGCLSDMSELDYFHNTASLADKIITLLKRKNGTLVRYSFTFFTNNSWIQISALEKLLREAGIAAPQFLCNERYVQNKLEKQLWEMRFNWTNGQWQPNSDDSDDSRCPEWVFLPGNGI
ncbi:hypothetical protein ACHQM5_013298 [Ranunculus cassubicifolius]